MDVKKIIKNPYYIFRICAGKGHFKTMSDEKFIKYMFRARVGKWPDLKNPTTFNEKLQWLKLYDRKPIYTTMVDKYEVKKYVADRIGEEYIIPTLGVWDKFEDIDFDILPNQFVLKCTHDSGGLCICKDKSTFDIAAAKEKINKSLRKNYYYSGREWPYKDVKPRIIAEQYMEDGVASSGLTDYKFYCFNGEAKFLYISKGLENHSTASISFVTMDWQFAPYERLDYKPYDDLPPKPECFDEMVRICNALSYGVPFLRVDLYHIKGKIYFSELTFSPCSGFMQFKNYEHDYEIGSWLKLPQRND